GTIIAHQDKKKVLQNQNLKDKKEVASVLNGREGAIELQDETEGKLISSFAPICSLGWGLVLRQKQDEAYRFSGVMKMQSWIIIILSELLASLASIFMGKKLAAPIKNLSSGIKSVAAGNLDHKIIPRMRDDIGELIRSFNSMAKKLKMSRDRERLSAIGEAAAWIAHELKNSLVSIKSFVQLFPVRYRDERFRDKFSRLVPGEINRMERMFKELSDFSSHSELSKTRTNMKEVIDNTLELMREEFINKKINLNYSLQNDNFPIEADPERLKQVFMNLIINSINAMPQGGSLAVSIEKREPLQAESIPARIEVRIKDTGKGISGELLRKLFEPLHTTKDGGMGLGLTISRKIVEEHGGNIDVESEIDRGTTFIVRLPYSKLE
ncbi:MAG: HAMP domain-containing protein, partial [Candidatus Omnitrophica bacterium]|nr:HAMP domain-containing protein [Candidatus Omnitrophota bacterium]